MKITMIGASGSGKSTLSRKISQHYSIPRLEIDRLWFSHGGHHLTLGGVATEEDKEVVREKITEDIRKFLSENTDWVIDGTYSHIQPIIADKADTVVYIKRPLYKRVFSHLVRILKNDNRHPETTKWEDIKFSRVIVRRWTKKESNKIENLANTYNDKLVTLRSFKEINDYFGSLSD